jgi:hypothetical protein
LIKQLHCSDPEAEISSTCGIGVDSSVLAVFVYTENIFARSSARLLIEGWVYKEFQDTVFERI